MFVVQVWEDSPKRIDRTKIEGMLAPDSEDEDDTENRIEEDLNYGNIDPTGDC